MLHCLRILVALCLAIPPARAAEGCLQAIAEQEAAGDIPAGLLGAIGRVESGRRDPASGTVAPWPWSVNAEGQDLVFANRDDAVAWVAAAQARGVRSIDVGCMQVNLMYHPTAFADLDEAFAPEANVRYAVGFLRSLHRETGDWTTAAGRYHSATPELAGPYVRQVMAAMQVGSAGMSIRPAVFAYPYDGAGTSAPARPDPVTVLLAASARRVVVVVPGMDSAVNRPGLPRVYRP